MEKNLQKNLHLDILGQVPQKQKLLQNVENEGSYQKKMNRLIKSKFLGHKVTKITKISIDNLFAVPT